MKKNMGSIDKAIRLIIAVILVGLYFSETLTGTWGIVGLVVATIMVLTSLANSCPLYGILGINTSVKEKTTQVKGNG